MGKGTNIGFGLAAAFVTAVAVTGVSADPIAGKDLAESGVSSAMVRRADRSHPQPCSASFLVVETDIWGSPPTHGLGSRNRAMIASSRSRGGYRSVIRMAAGGTANRTLPDDMGIAT